jgi:hypothetical protein
MVGNQRFGDRTASIFRVDVRAGDVCIAGISLDRQQCSGYIFMITNFNPEDGSSTPSETSVSNRQTTRRNNPENRDNCFSAMETLKHHYTLLMFSYQFSI